MCLSTCVQLHRGRCGAGNRLCLKQTVSLCQNVNERVLRSGFQTRARGCQVHVMECGVGVVQREQLWSVMLNLRKVFMIRKKIIFPRKKLIQAKIEMYEWSNPSFHSII